MTGRRQTHRLRDCGQAIAEPDFAPRILVNPEKVMAAYCLSLRRDFAGALDEVDIRRLELLIVVTENIDQAPQAVRQPSRKAVERAAIKPVTETPADDFQRTGTSPSPGTEASAENVEWALTLDRLSERIGSFMEATR
jgi:hypothetical protein